MKHLLTVSATVLSVVSITACGGHAQQDKAKAKALSQSAQTKQSEAYFRGVSATCLKKGGGLKAEVRCVFPKGHARQGLICAAQGFPKNRHDQGAIEGDLTKCAEKYR